MTIRTLKHVRTKDLHYQIVSVDGEVIIFSKRVIRSVETIPALKFVCDELGIPHHEAQPIDYHYRVILPQEAFR